MPLKNLTQTPFSQHPHTDPRISDMPSIRLISATPSAVGSSAANSTIRAFDDTPPSSRVAPWESMPPPPPVPSLKHRASKLLPKASTSGLCEAAPNGTRLVPKKSKRRLLGSLGNALPGKENAKARDFSDVVRRVAAGTTSQAAGDSSKLRGGFEIYVDPSADPDMSDIMVVKKQKSRAALDDMGWGPTNGSGRGVLGEVTNSSGNVSSKKEKEKEGGGLLKVKVDEEKKWWSIGRGRRDSKDEKKVKDKENVSRSRASSPVPPARSQTPDPFKGVNSQKEQSRGRFNSLDAGILLGFNKKKSSDVLASATSTVRVAEPVVAPSPPPTMRRQSRTDILSNPQLHPQTQPKRMERIPTPPQMTYSRSATPTFGGLLSVGNQNGGLEAPPSTNASNQGSIALRAMRSVKSFARIGNWAQGKGEDLPKKEKEKTVKEKKRAKEGVEEKKSKRNSKKDKEEKEETRRFSGSSFEAGHLTPGSVGKNSSVSRKHSILGLGLPSSIRLPGKRSGSTASSVLAPVPPVPPLPSHFGTVTSMLSTASSDGPSSDNAGTITGRLSVDSAVLQEGRRQPSIKSTVSSLRPNSIASTASGNSSGSQTSGNRCSSSASIRWDEEGLQRAKAEREKESVAKRGSVKPGKKTNRESRRSSEGRRRTAISDIFPEVLGVGAARSASPEPEVRRYPIVTIEEATADGHGEDLNAPIMEESEGEEEESRDESVKAVSTPMKKPRPRPLSEQLLGKARPAPVHDGGDGVLSILSAATNDLAQLINNLDLQATPATPDMTPLRASPFGSEPSMSASRSMEFNNSPLKQKTVAARAAGKGVTVRPSAASISSLRPYGQPKTVNNGHPTLRGKPSFSETMLGKAIPSWPLPENTSLASLRANLKPVVSPKTSSSGSVAKLVEEKNLPSPPPAAFVKTHKRSMTPIREPDPAPVFEPLQPPPFKRQANVVKAKATPERIRDTFDDGSDDEDRYRTLRAKSVNKGPSERTFGSLATAKTSVPHKISRGSKQSSASSASSNRKLSTEERGVPMSREARRMLGMSGTMGGSTVSAYQVEFDDSDPDSDVPEELRHILRRDEADAISYRSVNVHDRESDDEEEYRDDTSFTGRLHYHDDEDMTVDLSAPRPRSASPFDPGSAYRVSTFTDVQMSEAEIQQAMILPVFRAHLVTDIAGQDADVDDESFMEDENNTKKSFDFTGELAKLSEADSDRRSFVEQLENAFKTPAKIDLRADFGVTLDVPPVPPLPDYLRDSRTFPAPQWSQSFEPSESEESVGIGRDARSVEEPVVEMRASSFSSGSQSRKQSGGSKLSSSPPFKTNDPSPRSVEAARPNFELPSLPSTAGSVKPKSSFSSSFSRKSDQSDGELNRSFKFGGLSSASPTTATIPRSPGNDSLFDDLSMEDSPDSSHCRPLTLSDVIPPPSHVREVSFTSSMLDDYEDSALKSFIAQTMSDVAENPNPPQPRERTISEASFNARVSRRFSNFIPLTRPSSGISFAGIDHYDEVRRGFEFNDQRPNFYPGPSAYPGARTRVHRPARDSVMSIASVSSYGRVIREGAPDPFDYGVAPPHPHMPSLQERSLEEDMTQSSMGTHTPDDMSDMSTQVDDTFSFIHNRPVLRRRVDSDASSFYCTGPTSRAHRRRSSNYSVSSISGMPPVSMHNKGARHHRRSSSVTSANSIALAYAHGGVGARAILARHHRESVGSLYSDFSPMRPTARPGLGDKMFDTAAPLAALAKSPSESIAGEYLSRDYGNKRASFSSFDYYDSIIDADDAYRFRAQRDSIAEVDEYEYDERPSSMADSLFDQTRNRTSSGSLFGNDDSGYAYSGFRPLSESTTGDYHNSPMKEDDTMISMIGGGHVRRRSVVSMLAASPCVRMEKKSSHRRTARAVLQEMKDDRKQAVPVVPSPAKAKIVEPKPSIVSTASTHFGDQRMISAQHGLLARQSLEESVLVASGEERSVTFQAPVFSRPKPTSRSRSSTCTSASDTSGRDTPPLSPSEVSSVSGSFSSIDTVEMSAILSNVSQPSSTLASARARAQNNGHSHRRGYSRSRVSRASVYETIDEEDMTWSSSSSPAQSMFGSANKNLQTAGEDSTAVYVVGSDTESLYNTDDMSTWDDERGIVALRKFYNLKDEAQSTVQESQRTWTDTPFSLFAVQSFEPPRQPEAMKAMLEQSVRAFVPLPAELRRIRSRKNSRPSPYPTARVFKTSFTSSTAERLSEEKLSTSTTTAAKTQASAPTPVLKEKKLNTRGSQALKPKASVVSKEDSAQKPSAAIKAALGSGTVRQRVPSATRRSALGWSKKGNGPKSSSDKKENVVGEGSIVMTPGDGLRLNRPRPRNSRTPASQARPRAIRI